MWTSPLFWIVFAIVLFWAFGAYNRLMRLRAAALQAFGSLDAHLVRWVALLGEFGAAHQARSAVAPGASEQELVALQGATTQLSASLAVARARPLQADAIAALAAARDVLQTTWPAAMRTLEGGAAEPTPSSASPEVDSSAPEAAFPSLWARRWTEQAEQNAQAIAVFNAAVAQHNAAIRQFPASVLAWVFSFKVARGL